MSREVGIGAVGQGMKVRRSAAALVMALLVLSFRAASLPAREPSAEEAVRAAEAARAQALLHADTAALSRLLAPEFVEVSRLGQLRSRADNIRDIASGTLKLTRLQFESTTVHVYGDVAVLRAIADNAGSFGGFPFAGRVWYTRVYVHRDGRWQAVATQQTMIP